MKPNPLNPFLPKQSFPKPLKFEEEPTTKLKSIDSPPTEFSRITIEHIRRAIEIFSQFSK